MCRVRVRVRDRIRVRSRVRVRVRVMVWYGTVWYGLLANLCRDRQSIVEPGQLLKKHALLL
jgi:hypothetical protein